MWQSALSGVILAHQVARHSDYFQPGPLRRIEGFITVIQFAITITIPIKISACRSDYLLTEHVANCRPRQHQRRHNDQAGSDQQPHKPDDPASFIALEFSHLSALRRAQAGSSTLLHNLVTRHYCLCHQRGL